MSPPFQYVSAEFFGGVYVHVFIRVSVHACVDVNVVLCSLKKSLKNTIAEKS